MLARRIVGSALASFSLACGQPAQDGGEDPITSSETGEDTDSTAAECPSYGLSLSEAYSGHAVAAVMFPGANYVTGSCGGGGTDATYRVTSQKTSYYHLSSSAQALGAATFHIHAGDSCHGPELYCATGPYHDFKLMLAEGETVTMVVDTEPDLVIPENGLQYTVAISWGSPPPEPCYPDELHACNEAPVEALDSCMATYACGDLRKATMCIDEFHDGLVTCAQEFCPDGPESWDEDCGPACDNLRASCGTENGCDANTCNYQWDRCMDLCGSCNPVYFDFEYTGECELALPGPPSPFHAPFVSLEIGGQYQPVSEPGLACGDPEASDVVWQTDSILLLCDPACEAFALAGTAEVTYGTPPCE
jgi:hypothetical protein